MKPQNAVPPEERGEKTAGPARDPGKVIATPYRLDDDRRIGIQIGETGDCTPIFSVCVIWTSQPFAVSSIDEFCYSFPDVRAWIEKKYKPMDTIYRLKKTAATPLPSPPFGIVCRGCKELGTACGKCSKCQDPTP